MICRPTPMSALVAAIMRAFAQSFALPFTEALEYLATGDVVVAVGSAAEDAAIVVEGEYHSLFAWTLGATGVPRLIDMDEYVASIGGLVIVRRLDVGCGDSDILADRMADVIAHIIDGHAGLDDVLSSCTLPTPAMLVVYTYMRMDLAHECKSLGRFDAEDLLLDGDFDEVLAPDVTLTRDAYIVRQVGQ